MSLTRTIKRTAILSLGSVLIANGAARAATVITTDPSGSGTNPSPPSTAEAGWNPTPHCDTNTNPTLDYLLECLAVWIDPTYGCPPPSGSTNPWADLHTRVQRVYPPELCNNPTSRMEYRVQRIENGLDIKLRDHDETDSTEPYRLMLKEDDSNIQWTSIAVDRPNLKAWIKGFEQTPTDVTQSTVDVIINGVTITVTLRFNDSLQTETNKLITAIRNAGFSVTYSSPYINVWWDSRNDPQYNHTIRSVSYRSWNQGISKSEIHLDPDYSWMATQ